MDDIIINKTAAIERCIARIHQEFEGDEGFRANYTKQDSVILNLQRACEAAIDIANYVIRLKKLGVPQSSRDSFSLLERAGLIEATESRSMQAMIGLRNIAVHAYQALNLDIVIHVISQRLGDFTAFVAQVVRALEANK